MPDSSSKYTNNDIKTLNLPFTNILSVVIESEDALDVLYVEYHIKTKKDKTGIKQDVSL